MVIIGNWKMNKDLNEAELFLESFYSNMEGFRNPNLNLFIAPSFPIIMNLKELISNNSRFYNLNICAQNCHHQNKGAYTGEVSVKMLKSLDVSSVIIGHSERRKYFNETNDILTKKVSLCVKNNLLPVFCFGETLEERKKGNFLEIIDNQISVVKPYIEDKKKIILAYEPIWAIGTGKTPSLQEIEEVHSYVKEIFPNINVLYGGSLNSINAKDILTIPQVNGCLVGGASLDPVEFVSIIRLADDIC